MSSDGALRAFEPTTGAVAWTHRSGRDGQVRGSPTIGPDGTIYHPYPDGTLRAVRPDGTLRWSVSLGAGGYFAAGASPAIGADGTLYAPAIADSSDVLFAVSHEGDIVWRVANRDRALEVSPVVAPDGTILYDGRRISPDGRIVGETGAGAWGVTLGPGGVVYGGSNSALTAYTFDGRARWTVGVGTSGPPPPIPAGQGFVYGLGWDPGALYLITPSGQLLSRDAECHGLDTPAMGADGTLYAPCGGGVRAFGR
jgi:outer membrane protein assembly factor BamB